MKKEESFKTNIMIAAFLVAVAAFVVLSPALYGHHGLAWAAGEMDQAFDALWQKVIDFMGGTPGSVIAALLILGGVIMAVAVPTRRFQGLILVGLGTIFRLIPAIATDFVGTP